MAVDTRSLVYLIDPFWQGENVNGKPLVGGYMEVYVAGTDTKYITWSDWDGARHPFRIPLKSDGRACILVEPQYTYDCYLYDSFGNLACSRLNVSPDIGGDVSVSGLTQVYHDETISGNGTPYEPLGIVSGGKTYEGIEPIVVNNTEDKISANHVPLGVQDPLYFVQDDEEGCIIGFSGQTIPEGVMSESGLGFENDKITGYNGSAFSAGNEYEAGSYVDITDNTISVTGLQPEGDYAYNSALSSKLDVTASSQFLTGLPEDLVYSADITGLATTAQLDEKLDKSDSANFYPMNSNPSGYLTELPSDLATTGWVDSQGYLTALDIPESAVWNATTQTVSANSAAWAGGTANPQIPVTGINGIKISESGDKVVFEVSADYYPGNNPSGFITGVDLTPYQEKADMTAYATVESLTAKQDAGDYLSASDSANFLLTSDSGNFYPMNENPSGYLTAHQSLADYQLTADMTGYLTTADSANFLTAVPAGTMNESAFEYDANDKISGYNGSAFAGGSDVPEGVMVESGLEYNAVQEISGYNGSAIAQYGAEKQWLVHDDTLVHASNSAQYALGVNLSAVAQLLGVDETVLWEGSANAGLFPISLSEPTTAFKEIKFVWTPRYQGDYGCPTVVEVQNTDPHSGTIKYTLMHAYWNANEPWLGAWYLTPTDNYTKIASEKNAFCDMMKSQNAMSDGLNCYMWKIIGIGRKS